MRERDRERERGDSQRRKIYVPSTSFLVQAMLPKILHGHTCISNMALFIQWRSMHVASLLSGSLLKITEGWLDAVWR